MSIFQDVNAEQLANLLCNYREALAHDVASENETQPNPSSDRTSTEERRLMVAATRLALMELASRSVGSTPKRKYYAQPGEAEWGC